MDVGFAFVAALSPGKTVGDLDVLVDGQVIPRRVVGTTQDAWYEEDTVIAGRIKMWTDLSGSPISIEIRRKAGTVDANTTNTARLALLHGTVVGSTAQVVAGFADYDTLSAAITATVAGGRITLLPNVTVVENITVGKKLYIVGSGHSSQVNGTITLDANSDFATVKDVYCNQFILLAGAVGVQVLDCFWDTNPSDANSVGTNRITGMLTV